MRIALAGLVAAATFAIACGGQNSTTGPTPQGLNGTWVATKAEYTSVATASKKVDVVAQGTTVTLVLAGSSFTLTIKDPGLAGNVTTGTWSSSTDTLTMKPTTISGQWQFDMALSGSTLTLTGGSVVFDFTDTGNPEEAKLNLTLTRQ